MALVTIQPTEIDRAVANAIAAHTNPPTEEVAQALTWGADEHVLLGLTALWWLYSRRQGPEQRRTAGHLLLATLVAAGLPHVLKSIVDQQRPDRLTVRGHWRGIPWSGKRLDAFPSGHAMHVGALASAASQLPSHQRNAVWLAGAGLIATRVVLLAHWVSDVVVGFTVGVLTERWLRQFTGYGQTDNARRSGELS